MTIVRQIFDSFTGKTRREHELLLARLSADTQQATATAVATALATAMSTIASSTADATAKQVEAMTAAQAEASRSLLALVERTADTQNKQTAVLQTWMDSFKVYDAPSSNAVRDEDEVTAALERESREAMEDAGDLANFGPNETLSWIHRTVDKDILNEAVNEMTAAIRN